jgi:hypothetical protein
MVKETSFTFNARWVVISIAPLAAKEGKEGEDDE